MGSRSWIQASPVSVFTRNDRCALLFPVPSKRPLGAVDARSMALDGCLRTRKNMVQTGSRQCRCRYRDRRRTANAAAELYRLPTSRPEAPTAAYHPDGRHALLVSPLLESVTTLVLKAACPVPRPSGPVRCPAAVGVGRTGRVQRHSVLSVRGERRVNHYRGTEGPDRGWPAYPRLRHGWRLGRRLHA
jgi:hypothetical protein